MKNLRLIEHSFWVSKNTGVCEILVFRGADKPKIWIILPNNRCYFGALESIIKNQKGLDGAV